MRDDDKIVLRELIEHLSIRTPYPGPEGAGEPIDTYSDLRAYWLVILKRQWTILTVVLALTTLVAIYSFKVEPIYQATGRVEVDAETPQFVSDDHDDRFIPTDPAFLQTQVDVLSSDNLAWQTVQLLRLDLNPRFNPAAAPPTPSPGEPRVAAQARLIRIFEDNLHVELVRGSRIVRVSFDNPDPNLAAKVVNALVKNYIEYNFMTKYVATRQASGWMEQQLDELKAKVEKSQQALVDYERQNAIVNVSDKENIVEQRLATLSQDLTAAENDLAQEESLVDLVKANPDRVALLAQNELLVRLEEKEADAKTEYTDSLARYGPAFPKVVRLRDQLDAIQSMIAQERNRTVERIRRDYEASLAKKNILAAEVAQEKVEVGKLNQLLIQHNILKHEFETNQQLYDSLLKRLKDATVAAGFRATNIHIVDDALVPATPVRPKKLLNIAIGLIVGLILGITLAFVQEGLDNSVKNAEEMESLIPVPSLAVIPSAESLLPSESWHPGRNGNSALKNGSVALAVFKRPGSVFAESCRSLCTSILHSTAPRPPQVLLLTSTQPGEGKTSISLNLAVALAQRGNRVLLVDGDLRKPGFGSTLGLNGKDGLCGVLTGECAVEQALQSVPSIPNLWALPVGQRAPNPAELLSSTTMENLVRDWRGRFDHVVIDSPPLLMVTDATVLSRLVDGVILVVESGVTPRNACVRAYKILQNSDAKVLGTVLNKMDFRNDGYYGYAYRTYHTSYYSDELAREPEEGEKSNGDKSPADSPLRT
jgi:succinoglycan biosynthesis transport protein ExoP